MKPIPAVLLGLSSVWLSATVTLPSWADSVPMLVAQTNQSDVTGTGVGDIPAPTVVEGVFLNGVDLDGDGEPDDFDGDGDVDDQDLAAYQAAVERAQELASELDEAQAACEASRVAVANQPRRFARGPAPAVCTSAECDRLTQLMQEARSLLSRLGATDRASLERIGIQLW